MNGERPSLSHHPAPHRARVPRWRLAVALLGAPLAWFVQLNLNYGLLSWPCYPGAERMRGLHGGWQLAYPVAIVVYLLCIAACVIGFFVSRRMLRETENEVEGSRSHLLEIGAGRTRFMAIWGMLLSIGFGLVIIANGVAFLLVPPCAL